MEKIFNLKEKYNISEVDFLHILAIILRANSEINYALQRNKELDNFVLKEMENFIIEKNFDTARLVYIDDLISITIEQLKDLSEKIYLYLNKEYYIGYDYKNFDPIYMSLFLYKIIPQIIGIKYDKVYIDDFRLLRRDSQPVTLEYSESYKALKKGHECDIYTPFNSNHIVDSDYDRLLMSLNSIKENNYPYLEQYIILYNNQLYIRDGQHRASILKYLYGNIKIPVLRIYMEGDLDND